MESLQTVSVHLPFQNIENCRDMAGITNRNNKHIKPGKLFRSANLHKATDQDIYTLQHMHLDNVVDLRTDVEIALEPDRLLSEWNTVHLPLIQERKLAASQGGTIELAGKALLDTDQLLQNVYRRIVTAEHAQEMFRRFFALLLEGGTTLWHCTQGKDRTGLTAVLLLTALDVDESIIIEDYLQTNLYLHADEVREDVAAQGLLGRRAGKAVQDIAALSEARMDYYNAAKEAVEEKYGSWKEYLHTAIGLSQEDMEKLQTLYME